MKYIKTVLTSLLLMLCINASSVANEADWMPDANLRTAVQTALGLGNGDALTKEAMANLTELSAERSNIANITGLEHATNLTDLQLPYNQITDISPLRDLTSLTHLVLDDNPIGDITDLGNLTNLKTLQVKNCGITDVSPLLTLVNLTTLRIAANNLTNAHLLSTLTNLNDIDITIPDPPLPPDVDPPGVRLTIPSVVQNGAFSVTITFTEAVSGFTESDLSLSGTATASITAWHTTDNTAYIAGGIIYVAGSPTYTATITPTASGTVTISVAANVATDVANNPNTAATAQTVTVSLDTPPPRDTDAPRVSISAPLDVQNGAFDATITFTEAVSGFTQSDLSLSGTATASLTAWNTTDNTTYTATITPTTSGTVIFNIEAGVATDAANNPNIAATAKTVNVDVDSPTVTIGVPSGTQTGVFDATITFSETVSDFAQSDVSLTGAAASITAWNANANNTIYTATITPTASGTVTINVAANVATDAANNPNTAATAKTVTVQAGTVVNIPDAGLRARLERVLGKNPGDPITDVDMATLTEFGARNSNISDLTGLGSATNLTALALSYNSITDLSPIAGLAKLTNLGLGNNSITDLSPLSELTSLTKLELNSNSITNLSPLAGLTNLADLYLKDNSITDIRSLVSNTGLGRGDTVDLRENALDTDAISTHIPALKRRGVTVQAGTVVNIPDAGLRARLERVLGKNPGDPITDVDMAMLTELGVRNSKVSDLTGLGSATNLTVLTLSYNSITDLSPIAGLAKLTNLGLGNNSITDLSPLSELTSLTKLELNSNSITNLSPLAGLTNLADLYLKDNSITDIRSLVSNTGLGRGDTVDLRENALDTDAINTHIPTLQSRGVTVLFDALRVSISVPSAAQNGAFDTTITFTEAVSDFTQSDLSLSGTATASITAWNTADNTTYTATITPTTSGTVIFNIEAGVATDAANNPNTAAETKTVNVDIDKPTVTIGVPSGAQTGAFDATITFSETVSDFAQSDVSLTGSAASITTWSANNNKTVYTATITPTASGTVTINVAANVAKDAANNPNTAATAKTVTVDVDAPSVSISVPSAAQNGAFDTTITFTEAVSGFTQSDLSLSGTATASITAWNTTDNTTYTTATITPTTSGTVIFNIEAGVATDAANNPNTAATAKTVNVDIDKPTVTIGVPSGTQTGAFNTTITFSETVSGFAQSDVALTGSAASITGWKSNNNKTVYTTTITPTASGTVTISVAANVAKDAANNPNTAATAKTVTVSLDTPPPRDTDAPSVSISVPSVVQNGAFSVTITFTEAVSGFTQSDLSLSGTATASITSWNANTKNTTYTATITPTTSGTVILNVAANVAKDAANNQNTAATAKTVNVDVDKPTVAIGVPSGPQTGAFNTTITFSETVSGFAQSDVALTGSAASITAWNANNNKTVYTATITPTASGTVTISVAANVAKDAANNPNTAATAKNVTVSLDTTAPSVSITVPTGPQNSAFDATITFTEAVSGFTQSDLSLSGTATASITSWNANTENTTYTATITPTTSGTVILNVAANVAKDAANNQNTAATAKTVNVDVDKPTVTIGVPSGTQTGAFNTTITFSEAVSGFAQSDVSLTGSAASITAWSANNNKTVYTATITPTASGTVTISVAANVAKDAANNPNTAATAKTVNVDVDRPTVTIGVPSGTQTGAFDATITFSETVSDFAQSDVSLTGAAASITAWNANDNNTIYTATITPTASGTVTISVAANVAKDAANNPNTAATAKTVTVDVTDVNENRAPTFNEGSNATRSIAENTGSGVNIGSAVSATDPDNDTLTYTLGGTDTSSFSINSTNGQLQTSASLDYENKNSYTVTVSVSDGKGGSDSISVTINVTNVNENGVVNIPDPNLRAAIEEALGKTSGATITEADMATLTSLDVLSMSNDNKIFNLTGLEYAINLTTLESWGNRISDISPVQGLTKLTKLRIGNQGSENGIKDISAVAGLTNLTYLAFEYNGISDISPLAGLTNLTDMVLTSNSITNISAVTGLTNLTTLGISGNHISDISPLAGLTKLTVLDCGRNDISNLSPLSGLTELTELYLTENVFIRDISPLAGLTKLTKLSLYGIYITNISPVSNLTELTFLNLNHNSITDISPVSNLTKLTKLYLVSNDIVDISAVAGLTNLDTLYLHYNDIENISAVAGLTNLDTLYLHYNNISDLSPLVANTGLKGPGYIRVNVSANPLSAESINTHIPALRNRGVTVTADNLKPPGAPSIARSAPVFSVSGAIVDQTARQNLFRITVKNLSNAKAALTIDTNGVDYQLEVAAGEAGDILEISAQSADPSIAVQPLRYTLTAEDVLRGRIQLPALVAYEIPTETKLLANYPNPFNPETWIPYRLAADAFVTLTIYDSSGQIIRAIDVGHQIAAVYESRSQAIHWDGRNASGEPVSSGVYFYHLSAGDYSATRRMLILK